MARILRNWGAILLQPRKLVSYIFKKEFLVYAHNILVAPAPKDTGIQVMRFLLQYVVKKAIFKIIMYVTSL